MTAPISSQPLMSALALASHASVASVLDAPLPAIVLGGDGRVLRFMNAAASQVLGVGSARSLLDGPAPLDEAICRHLQRIAANGAAGRQSTERIRFYRGIRPIVLTVVVEHLGVVGGQPALLVTLPEMVRPNVDGGLQATLDLYTGSDDLITAFGSDDVLAVSGRHAVLDDAPGEIEALADRATSEPVEMTRIHTPHGTRLVLLVRTPGSTPVNRLMYIGPLEPMTLTLVPAPTSVADEPAIHPDGFGTEPDAISPNAEAEPSVSASIGTAEILPIPESTPLFAFVPQAKPVRFAWELDHDNRVVRLSPEFANILGSVVAPQPGEGWIELADRLQIDADGRIAQLIHGRSAWHGQTVDWPVEGMTLRVPVTLTAMPLADADRQFAGFRGFGVIRSDAGVVDPLGTGLRLAELPVVEIVPAAEGEHVATDADHASDHVFQPEHAPEHVEPHVDEAPAPHVDLMPDLVPGPLLAEETRYPRLVEPAPSEESDLQFLTLMPPAHISPETLRLTGDERNAFRQIAEALGARFEGDEDLLASTPVPEPVKPEADNSIRILSTQDLLDELNRPARAASASIPLDRRRSMATDGDTTLIDRMPIAVALSRDETIIHVNAAFLTLTGYETLEALDSAGGLDVLFAGPHAAKGWSEDRNRHHIPLVTHSGRVLPVDARIASVPWPGGTALLITLIAADRPGSSVTIPTAESAATANARIQELESILATASDGIVMLAADGRIVSANAPAETLFGIALGRMADMHLTDLMAPESRRPATDYINALARNGIGSLLVEGRELVGQAPPDRRLQLFATIAKVAPASGSGQEPRFAAVFRDISRWKTSEEELTFAKRRAEEASIQKSDFLAKISHEIRTPLNAIIGFSEVMLGERFGPIGVERYKDYLRDIQSSGTHIMSLVNDLLDLSKVESGKLDLKFESVQLTDILAECVQFMQPQASRQRVIIRASLTQGLPPVVADHRSIRQIVLNLLSNAIKFTPPGGQVIVSAALEETSEVVIRVRDTGYGMSPNEIEVALEPFRQVHNARGRNSEPGPGTGLGLPLTKALVEANRAALRIESAVNQGTLVQVTFPAPRVLAAE